MTTEAISETEVFELISTRVEIAHWSTRMVLKELAVHDNNRNRKLCRGALGALSKQGKIQRDSAGKDGELVTYSACQV
jgi:hypothetical protein